MSEGSRTDDELLSAEAVARALGVELITVYRWCRQGRLICLKPGKSWRIRRSALDAFLRRAERPQSLVARLGTFLEVPDQVLAVAEDTVLLARLDAAFFQVAAARDGLLVKIYDPQVTSQDELRAGLRRDGVEIDQLEAAERFRWCPLGDPAGVVVSLQQLLDEEPPTGRSVWAGFNLSAGIDLATVVQQQVELAELVATTPIVVTTGVVEPTVQEWPAAELQWQLLRSLRGVLRHARSGLMLSRVVPAPTT